MFTERRNTDNWIFGKLEKRSTLSLSLRLTFKKMPEMKLLEFEWRHDAVEKEKRFRVRFRIRAIKWIPDYIRATIQSVVSKLRVKDFSDESTLRKIRSAFHWKNIILETIIGTNLLN